MRYLNIGYIAGVYSFKGYVKMKPTADDLEMITGLKQMVLSRDDIEDREFTVDDIKLRPDGLMVVKFRGVDDEACAKLLRSCTVKISIDEMPEIDDDYAYWYQLEGAVVFDETGARLGVLHDVLEGATDIFEIKFDDGRMAFISNNKDHVKSIDVDNRKVIIDSIGLVFE